MTAQTTVHRQKITRTGKNLRTLLSAAALALALSACSAANEQETKPAESYTDEQCMLVIVSERNRCAEVYSERIWDTVVTEDGGTYRTYFTEQIRAYLKRLRVMELMAEDLGLELSAQEKKEIKELAGDYCASLTEADRSCIGADEDDVRRLYEACALAELTADEVTKDVDLEISDSEAKVMAVQELAVATEEEAAGVYEIAVSYEADFSGLATTLLESGGATILVGRGERSAGYEEAVFALAEGEVTKPFQDGDYWFVVKCIDEYDEAATLERKEKLALWRKSLAFEQVYEAFCEENPIDEKDEFWETLVPDEGTACETDDFLQRIMDYLE